MQHVPNNGLGSSATLASPLCANHPASRFHSYGPTMRSRTSGLHNSSVRRFTTTAEEGVRSSRQPSQAPRSAADETGLIVQDFYAWQKATLSWHMAGIPIPKPVFWLALLQFVSFVPYSYVVLGNWEMIRQVRSHVDRLFQRAWNGTGSTIEPEPELEIDFPKDDHVISRTAVSWAVLAVVAFFWARRRTKNSFNSFVLARVLGEAPGRYPLRLGEGLMRKGESIKINDKDIKALRADIAHMAGIKAVQASTVLLLFSTLSTYGVDYYLRQTVRREILTLQQDVSLPETVEFVFSALAMVQLLLSWAALTYQPFIIVPFLFGRLLGFPIKRSEPPTVVTEQQIVREVDGGKEYITVREEKRGSRLTRTETRSFVADRSANQDQVPQDQVTSV